MISLNREVLGAGPNQVELQDLNPRRLEGDLLSNLDQDLFTLRLEQIFGNMNETSG